jgi:hypothetical protein
MRSDYTDCVQGCLSSGDIVIRRSCHGNVQQGGAVTITTTTYVVEIVLQYPFGLRQKSKSISRLISWGESGTRSWCPLHCTKPENSIGLSPRRYGETRKPLHSLRPLGVDQPSRGLSW